MRNGQRHEKRALLEGSVLFSTILLFLLCSFLFISVLESYRLTSDIGLRTKNFYIAKSMKQLFLTEYLTEGKLSIPGKLRYTTGTLVYHTSEGKLQLEITVPPFEYTFFETMEAEK